MFENDEKIEFIVENSSCIDSFVYNKGSKILSVIFKHGKTSYDFPDIEEEIVREWMQAESFGKYYNQVIKKLV